MPAPVAGPIALPGVKFQSWLLRFDKHGDCVSPKTRAALLDTLASKPGAPVILFSHGWNNEYEDATSRYVGLLKQLQEHFAQYGPLSQQPVFVGVLWPSTWLSFDKGPAIAAAPGSLTALDDTDPLKEELAERLSEQDRQLFYELVDMPRISDTQAMKLAALTASALKQESAAIVEGAEVTAADADAVLAGMKSLGSGTPAGEDDDELPEGGAIGDGPAGQMQSAGLLSYLDPRNALRVASVYQMKDRAGAVGWRGVSRLAEDILARSPKAPLHLVGHSYGAKVVLSAALAANLPRKITTMLLLQPAVSHLCFAKKVEGREGPGGYHDVLSKVERSIAVTFSAWDNPLHNVFHLALRRSKDLGDLQVASGSDTAAGDPPNAYAALGGYGPRQASEVLVAELPAPGETIPRIVDPGLVAFDGTKDKRVSSHGDVATSYTAWLLYGQMKG